MTGILQLRVVQSVSPADSLKTLVNSMRFSCSACPYGKLSTKPTSRRPNVSIDRGALPNSVADRKATRSHSIGRHYPTCVTLNVSRSEILQDSTVALLGSGLFHVLTKGRAQCIAPPYRPYLRSAEAVNALDAVFFVLIDVDFIHGILMDCRML